MKREQGELETLKRCRVPKTEGKDEQEQQLGGQQSRASGRAATYKAGREETSGRQTKNDGQRGDANKRNANVK